MSKLQRLLGVVVVLVMLLGSVGSVAIAEQGNQTGTDTQTGGGKAGPTKPKPTPPPAPEPTQTPQQPPSNNNGGGGGTTAPPRSGSGVSAQTGSQGPNRPAPQPVDPPSSDGGGGATGEFWILVDLSDFRMTAFRGDTAVLSSIVNHGRPGYNTPVGTFYVNSKYVSEDMTTFGNLPDVPYTMYFTNQGHALHGTYWTSVNGRLVSHGCVNLPTSVAKQLFNMTPIGTRVVIRY